MHIFRHFLKGLGRVYETPNFREPKFKNKTELLPELNFELRSRFMLCYASKTVKFTIVGNFGEA